ncbi:Non-canonical non-ribosomal peptide synthetase FUB8 [Cladobotryum mycophilum]|uniref:Non-canonical non-ribosomal peptide synthetase FUB8 n=1 Tax=Cladobotryum mycophilum TaxID=491253 RepID=A0ABR0SS17_9HYPO
MAIDTKASTTGHDDYVQAKKPDYGHRLIANVVDEVATLDPTRPFFHVPVSTDPRDGWKPITYKEIANAVNYVAHEIAARARENGPRDQDEYPTIAYIGPNDVRYTIMMLASIKAHHKVLFISSRNSQEAQLSLFKATDTTLLMYDESFHEAVKPWLKDYPIPSVMAPTAEVWLRSVTEPFPYIRAWEQGRWDPLVVLHTSGSTGIPKPVFIRQGSYAIADAQTALLPPSILEELSTNEDGIKTLSSLKHISFAGGSLNPAAGNRIVERGIRIINFIGSTECFPYGLHSQTDRKLWQYHVINAETMGAQFRPVPWDDELFEMFLSRNGEKEPGQKPFFYNFPDKEEWSTGDLFKRHPTLPDNWCYQGRADNVIVFSNGEKLNPMTIEDTISSHLAIRLAMVVGAQRFQPALILEPKEQLRDEAAAEALIDQIWPLVEEVNKVTVAHGRIARRLITISDPAKPFMTTPKGTLQRAATMREYREFIDLIFERDEANNYDAPVLDVASKESLAGSIMDILESRIGASGLAADSDLFNHGVDSLQVINLAKALQSGLKAAGVAGDHNTMAPRVIYANPTVKDLAGYLYSKITGESSEDASSQTSALAEIVSKYTADLPAPNKSQSPPNDEGQTILLTGTTGSLGAYMLDILVSNPRVSKIVALNRGQDGGKSRQPATNASRGLTTDFSKVDFVGVDLSQPQLGLDQSKYNELLDTADRIIHNAWPVNFNINVNTFEPYIRGVRHLADFSNQAAKKVPIIFISSISTSDRWDTAKGPVPEAMLDNLSLPQMGYGQSKLAGSLILDAAAKHSDVPATSIRVGQIAGPRAQQGVWNPQEFIPSLISSSVHLGVLPDSLGDFDVVDWTPVEDIARLILDVAGITTTVPLSAISGYFHGVNPSTTRWVEVAQIIKEFYSEQIKEIIPLAKWVELLEKSANDDAPAEKNPAIKLIDTYASMAKAEAEGHQHVSFAMDRTVEVSPTMKGIGPVNEGLVKNWCTQWKY